MAKKRMVMELGMGSSLRQQDYTRAACRAVEDALWHNSLSIADAFGLDRSAMIIEVEIGVQQPEKWILTRWRNLAVWAWSGPCCSWRS